MKYYGESHPNWFDYNRKSSRCWLSLFYKKKAESLNIHGFVRNKKDGSVFLATQGNKNDIESLIEWCYLGPPHSIVKSVKKISKPIESLGKFHIED